MPLTDIDHAELLRMIRESSLAEVLTALGKCCQAEAARKHGNELAEAKWLTRKALCEEMADADRVVEEA